MKRRLITRRNDRLLNILWEDGRITECSVIGEDDRQGRQGLILGGIYTARVSQIAGSLQAAFLQIGEEKVFYSISDNPCPITAGNAQKQGIPGRAGGSGKAFVQGDILLVQIRREALGSKDAVADSHISVGGRLVVLIRCEKESRQVMFSRRILSKAWKKEIRARLEPVLCGYPEDGSLKEPFSVLVRTNAADAAPEEIEAELKALLSEAERIWTSFRFALPGSCVWKPQEALWTILRDEQADGPEEIVTDIPEACEALSKAREQYPDARDIPIRFYDDERLSLSACYGLETALERALSRIVRLRSGAFLVIDRTEALTAIDVNTGKASGRAAPAGQDFDALREEMFLEINREAAREMMHQLRLRNLSGIIIVDFINMQEESSRETLLNELRILAQKDPQKTVIVDMTPLGLVEITRKKTRDTLDKQLNS